MKKRSLAVALLLAAAVAAPASAQSTVTDALPEQTYVFTTVDDYEQRTGYYVVITGVLQGESEARSIRFAGWRFDGTNDERAARCERLALMSLSKPGRYLLSVTHYSSVSYGPRACKLSLLR